MLHVELQEAKTGLSNAIEKTKKTNQAKEDLATKLDTLKKEYEKLEGNLQTKVIYNWDLMFSFIQMVCATLDVQ